MQTRNESTQFDEVSLSNRYEIRVLFSGKCRASCPALSTEYPSYPDASQGLPSFAGHWMDLGGHGRRNGHCQRSVGGANLDSLPALNCKSAKEVAKRLPLTEYVS